MHIKHLAAIVCKSIEFYIRPSNAQFPNTQLKDQHPTQHPISTLSSSLTAYQILLCTVRDRSDFFVSCGILLSADGTCNRRFPILQYTLPVNLFHFGDPDCCHGKACGSFLSHHHIQWFLSSTRQGRGHCLKGVCKNAIVWYA
jgi:hypothetical protein